MCLCVVVVVGVGVGVGVVCENVFVCVLVFLRQPFGLASIERNALQIFSCAYFCGFIIYI